jgi:hypothetical protein
LYSLAHFVIPVIRFVLSHLIHENYFVLMYIAIIHTYRNTKFPLKQPLEQTPTNLCSIVILMISNLCLLKKSRLSFIDSLSNTESDINVLLWLGKPANLPRSSKYLTSWSTDLLKEILVCSVSQEFPTFYGTRKFITAFTNARCLSLANNAQFQYEFL